jgi:hypothetical protein
MGMLMETSLVMAGLIVALAATIGSKRAGGDLPASPRSHSILTNFALGR